MIKQNFLKGKMTWYQANVTSINFGTNMIKKKEKRKRKVFFPPLQSCFWMWSSKQSIAGNLYNYRFSQQVSLIKPHQIVGRTYSHCQKQKPCFFVFPSIYIQGLFSSPLTFIYLHIESIWSISLNLYIHSILIHNIHIL